MPNVFFRSKPSRIAPAELAGRLRTAVAGAHPEAHIDVTEGAGEGPGVVLTWRDGPAAGRVADVVASVVNWELRTAGAPSAKPGAPSVVLARSFSDRALAVAVIRYQASNVRPYDSTSERALAGLAELLELDDPATSGYPVPDAMAGLLLDAADPVDLDARVGPDATPADRMAAKLDGVGYDALWATAWSSIG